MNLTIDQALQQGIEAHKSGKLQDAERLYRAILQVNPQHPDANHNLGVLAVGVGKPESALPFLKTALEANPKLGQFWISYINALIETKQFTDATTTLENGRRLGLSGDAITQLEQKLEGLISEHGSKQPEKTPLNSKKDTSKKSPPKTNKALPAYLRPKEPSQQEVNTLLSQYNAGNHAAAERLASSLAQKYPNHFFGWKALGTIYQQTGQFHESLEPMRRATHIAPNDAEAHNNLGNALRALGHLTEAEASYRKATRIKPDYAEAHSDLGVTLRALGCLTEAEACYREAIRLKPDLANAHYNYSLIKTFHDGDAQLPLIEQCYKTAAPTSMERMHASFALAKAYEDTGRLDNAFSLYLEGNRLNKAQLAYDIQRDIDQFDAIKSNFIQPTIRTAASLSRRPIFVLGMPRSGTTLVEQVLASHSNVYGAGELKDFAAAVWSHAIIKSDGKTHFSYTQNVIENIRKSYLTTLETLPTDKTFIVDKMPQNFRLIGYILSAFPEARIINLSRDPVAVCWSIFKLYFPAIGQGFACDLRDLATYYKLYLGMMDFWREQFPGRIYDLNYELLTENQEQETRSLLAYCGLEWQDRCLDFHLNDRAVSTASNVQVRKKMYTGSSQAWRKFEKQLQPLIKELEDSALRG